jgi:hypothetical protein
MSDECKAVSAASTKVSSQETANHGFKKGFPLRCDGNVITSVASSDDEDEANSKPVRPTRLPIERNLLQFTAFANVDDCISPRSRFRRVCSKTPDASTCSYPFQLSASSRDSEEGAISCSDADGCAPEYSEERVGSEEKDVSQSDGRFRRSSLEDEVAQEGTEDKMSDASASDMTRHSPTSGSFRDESSWSESCSQAKRVGEAADVASGRADCQGGTPSFVHQPPVVPAGIREALWEEVGEQGMPGRKGSLLGSIRASLSSSSGGSPLSGRKSSFLGLGATSSRKSSFLGRSVLTREDSGKLSRKSSLSSLLGLPPRKSSIGSDGPVSMRDWGAKGASRLSRSPLNMSPLVPMAQGEGVKVVSRNVQASQGEESSAGTLEGMKVAQQAIAMQKHLDNLF